jgi:inosine triphosphate pyrophosphatase
MSQEAMATARPVLNFISGNTNKLLEVRAILEPSIEVCSQNLDIEEAQGSVEEVTLAKCRKAADLVGILEDSHLV